MKKCVARFTKKYRTRPSPAFSAMDCKRVKMVGNDGRIYVSRSDVNGIYRWKPVTERKRYRKKR